MRPARVKRSLVLALSLSLLLAAAPASARAGAGSLSFPISGNAQCKAKFIEGMLALHSFMYDDAHQFFTAAIKADPQCAMARWGDAMAYSHPLWGEEDIQAARAQLAAVVGEEKLPAKERAFLQTARVLWGDGDWKARQEAWLKAAEKMRAEFPGDDEVALQYALALIANSERLKNTKRLAKSAAITMDIFQRKPNHPGAAHYLIHACDTADLAVLGLPAARAYAKIAPAHLHALHMPSHIFVQLGLWDEVVSSNEASWAASEVYVKKWGKTLDERDWHSYSWLTAGYLETGRLKKAEEMLKWLGAQVLTADGPETRFGFVTTARQYLMETGRWTETEQLMAPVLAPLPLEPGEAQGSMGCALHAPGATGKLRPPFGLMAQLFAAQARAEAAMRRADVKGVSDALAPAKKIYEAMEPWKGMRGPERIERDARFEAAMIAGVKARAEKSPKAWEEAIAAMKKLAEMREPAAGGPTFGTPHSVLYAETLAAAGKHKEALAAYDAALEKEPMMSRSLIGAARAAKAAGDAATARDRYAALLAKWKNADADHPDLAEVREGAKL